MSIALSKGVGTAYDTAKLFTKNEMSHCTNAKSVGSKLQRPWKVTVPEEYNAVKFWGNSHANFDISDILEGDDMDT